MWAWFYHWGEMADTSRYGNLIVAQRLLLVDVSMQSPAFALITCGIYVGSRLVDFSAL